MQRVTLFLSVLLVWAATACLGQTGTPDSSQRLELRTTEVAPRIDGAIEDLWLAADSSCRFIQHAPYEGAEPAEPTVVYMFQDKENLYAAFRLHSKKAPPVASYTKDEDYVILFLDPLGSKTTGYFFQVFGSGLFYDGLILDDGQIWDGSWEGVWDCGVALYPDRMEVEMKIPFKSIRYRKGLSEWGVQFQRHHARNWEEDHWVPVTEREPNLVSRWGTLSGVSPEAQGYYFELFPEGFVRYEKFSEEKAEAKPKASLSLKWDVTPQTTINATAYPDFAQIESDPYSLNLSRYPTYLQEQRPFFVDGSDIFRFSTIGESSFQPLNIFYSRMIGRSVNGEAVPIMGGAKLTHKSRDWSLGLLAAYTDEFDDSVHIGGYKYPVFEPKRSFGAARISRRLMGNSQVGLLASGTRLNSDTFNLAGGLDAVYRRGSNQFLFQGAISDRNHKQGWAFSSGFRGFTGPLLSMALAEAIDDSFDVSDIGFVPWMGRWRASAMTGPYWTFRSGPVRNFYLAAGVNAVREPGTARWSKYGFLVNSVNLRSNRGTNLELVYGTNYGYDPYRMVDFELVYRSASFNTWGILWGNNFNMSLNYEHGYNYQRGYAAYQGSNFIQYNYSIVSPLSVGANGNLWIEWSQNNHVIGMVPRLRPSFLWRITSKMTLNCFNEMVMATPGSDLGRTTLSSNRLGALFSWNFRPKSWLYVALNDYSGQEPRFDDNMMLSDHIMRPQYAIAAVKVRYLIYF